MGTDSNREKRTVKISGDILLLTDKARCPRCGKKSVDRRMRRCQSCNAVLLKSEDSTNRLTDQGIRDFYAFMPNGPKKGWIHSDHLLNPEKPNLLSAPRLKEPKPNVRPLPEGCSYGR